MLNETKSGCVRCGSKKVGQGFIMSMFNTDMICMPCKKKEQAHPKYNEAREAEHRAHQLGHSDFNGIGKPADL